MTTQRPNTGVPAVINEQTWYIRYPMKRMVHVMRPVRANPFSAAETSASVSPVRKKAGPYTTNRRRADGGKRGIGTVERDNRTFIFLDTPRWQSKAGYDSR